MALDCMLTWINGFFFHMLRLRPKMPVYILAIERNWTISGFGNAKVKCNQCYMMWTTNQWICRFSRICIRSHIVHGLIVFYRTFWMHLQNSSMNLQRCQSHLQHTHVHIYATHGKYLLRNDEICMRINFLNRFSSNHRNFSKLPDKLDWDWRFFWVQYE